MDRRLPRLAALAASLPVLGAAAASAGEHKTVRLTKAGNAAARAPQIKKGDLPPIGGWTGGRDARGRSSQTVCSATAARQSDLVVVGDAGAHWSHTGLQIWSSARRCSGRRAWWTLDWQRTIGTVEAAEACVRATAREVGGQRLALPLAGAPAVPQDRHPHRGVSRALQRRFGQADAGRRHLLRPRPNQLSLSTIAPASAAASLASIQAMIATELDHRIRA